MGKQLKQLYWFKCFMSTFRPVVLIGGWCFWGGSKPPRGLTPNFQIITDLSPLSHPHLTGINIFAPISFWKPKQSRWALHFSLSSFFPPANKSSSELFLPASQWAQSCHLSLLASGCRLPLPCRTYPGRQWQGQKNLLTAHHCANCLYIKLMSGWGLRRRAINKHKKAHYT